MGIFPFLRGDHDHFMLGQLPVLSPKFLPYLLAPVQRPARGSLLLLQFPAFPVLSAKMVFIKFCGFHFIRCDECSSLKKVGIGNSDGVCIEHPRPAFL